MDIEREVRRLDLSASWELLLLISHIFRSCLQAVPLPQPSGEDGWLHDTCMRMAHAVQGSSCAHCMLTLGLRGCSLSHALSPQAQQNHAV